MINVAVLGYGVVGSGVVEVLNNNRYSIAKKAGDEINVKYILDLRDFPGDQYENLVIHEFDTIINDSEIDIVAEAMGGTGAAYKFAKASLLAGKNYCTSNKELVAKYGPELLEIARVNNKNFLFEASVGGGIPIIRPLNQSLTADEITNIEGILNGTTNYILTKMSKDKVPYEQVLKEAQKLGYAEANPAADVEGYDTCRKIAILSSLAYGNNVNFEDIYTEGIVNISDIDFNYAAKLGKAIKLLGRSERKDNKFYAMVAPFLIDEENPLYNVNGVLNGILIRGDVIGDVMFYGSGAGKLPTASAVVADIVEAAKHLNVNIMTIWSNLTVELAKHADTVSKFFVRVKGNNVKRAEQCFPNLKLVEKVRDDEFAFITDKMTEAEYDRAQDDLENVINRIRVL